MFKPLLSFSRIIQMISPDFSGKWGEGVCVKLGLLKILQASNLLSVVLSLSCFCFSLSFCVQVT